MSSNKELIIKKGLNIKEVDKLAAESLLFKHFNRVDNLNPVAKRDVLSTLKETFPKIDEDSWLEIYRAAEQRYYALMIRIPPEAMINKIITTNDKLTEMIMDDSDKDITEKAVTISKLNEQNSKLLKLTDLPLKIELNFQTDMPIESLMKDFNKVIESKPTTIDEGDNNVTEN